jgi:hypothetical protein
VADIRLFVDFGSTFTKLVAFDLRSEELLGRVQVPSTVETDITLGLEEAFALLSNTVAFGEQERRQAVACSSAAGGLRVVCVGLVPEYTTEAGRRAALGAGAKIVGSHSFELSHAELREIEDIGPDIVLLTGGTDGGNKKVITHNAALLAKSARGVTNVIVAGNKSAYDEVAALFSGSGKNVTFTSNVMPEIGVLEVDRPITRSAACSSLASRGQGDRPGTRRWRRDDAHPAAVLGLPSSHGRTGLGAGRAASRPPRRREDGRSRRAPVPASAARPDMRSCRGSCERNCAFLGYRPTPSAPWKATWSLPQPGHPQGHRRTGELPAGFGHWPRCARSVPQGEAQTACHLLLSKVAVRSAVNRHAGSLRTVATPNGDVTLQRGKDLTRVGWVIGAGGPVSFSTDPRAVLETALFEPDLPVLLKPKAPDMLLDAHCNVRAHTLAQSEPAKALRLMRRYLLPLPDRQLTAAGPHRSGAQRERSDDYACG